MENHLFKVIFSDEDNVYRIIDLTDTSIVGVTEMLETDDELASKWRIEKNKDIREGKVIGAKVVGYNIFIIQDVNNTQTFEFGNDYNYYLKSIMRQMAAYFKDEVVDKNPSGFEKYLLAQYPKHNVEETKEKKKVPFAVWVIVGIVGCVLFMIVIDYLFEKALWLAIFLLCGLAFIPELFRKA